MKTKRYWLRGGVTMVFIGIAYNLIFLLRIIPRNDQWSGWFGLPSLLADAIIYYGWLGDATPTVWTSTQHFIIVVIQFLIIGLLLSLIYGKIKDKGSEYQKIALSIFLLVVLIMTYFVYSSYKKAGTINNIDGSIRIQADGNNSIYKNGQWQPYN